MHSDFLELLRLLGAHKVRYLVIGGYAFSWHVEPRYTKDLDLWVEASISNARRLLRALSEFGAPIDNLREQDLAKPGLLYVFGVPPLRVDVLNRIRGRKFAQAYKRRAVFHVADVAISVVSRHDLLLLKRAAGRPQDKADISKLTAAPGRPKKATPKQVIRPRQGTGKRR